MQTASIEQVWLAYSEQLKVWLRSRVGDPHDREDLLQDILIKSHKGIAGLEDVSRLRAWVFTLARNSLIDYYRRKGRQPDAQAFDEQSLDDEQTVDAQVFDEQQSNDLSTSQAEEQEALLACVTPFLDALPTETAQLLKAVDLEARSQKELAAELGISYSGLKSRVQRGRQQLRVLFEQCCEFEVDKQNRLVGYSPREGGCRKC